MKKLLASILITLLIVPVAFALEPQVLPSKGLDDIVRETHNYRSPSGEEGYIEWEWRMNGKKLENKATHFGAEERIVPTIWTEVPDELQMEKQETGSAEELIEEVIETLKLDKDTGLPVEKDGETVKKKTVKQVTVTVPVYSDVEVTTKHPYKDRFFTV